LGSYQFVCYWFQVSEETYLVGLVLLVCVLAATAILWGSGFGPVFTQ
jgi:hypothetical protein